MPRNKFPVPLLLALTLGPALAIGATLWFVGGLIQDCLIDEIERVPGADNAFDLVIFSRNCGATTTANTQAALVPPGEEIPPDAASFASVKGSLDLEPRWDAYGNIELTLPEGAQIYRQDDSVAGVSVIYR